MSATTPYEIAARRARLGDLTSGEYAVTAALLALVDELRETRRAVESLARPLSTPSTPCSGCGSPTHDGDGICPACAVSRRAAS